VVFSGCTLKGMKVVKKTGKIKSIEHGEHGESQGRKIKEEKPKMKM